MSDNPKPPYEQPSVEEIDTDGETISTAPGNSGSTLPLD
jgi:hypothetical protein